MTYVRINKFEEELVRQNNKSAALESMLTRFNRQVQADGVLREWKEHDRFEKPCDRRNRKMREAKLRKARKDRKDALRQANDKE